MDTLYVERCNGRWEASANSDGATVYVLYSYSLNIIMAYARRHGYRVVRVD